MNKFLIVFLLPFYIFAQTETIIKPVVLNSKPITLDGVWDSGWIGASDNAVTRMGFESVINIKSMIHHDTIYFLFEWDDKTLNSQHKPWNWSDSKKMYVVGDKREDRFIIRWGINIDSERVNSTNDVWYWGSVRVNQGKADDRYEILSKNPIQRGLKSEDFEGRKYYLQSQGDVGKRGWVTEYQKKAFWLDKSRYKPDIIEKGQDGNVKPSNKEKGSRGDVVAFAKYSPKRDGGLVVGWKWTMEVARKLSTGNFDDVEFSWGREYYFDLSQELYANAHIVHNISLMDDDTKSSEQFPLRLKMPEKPLGGLDQQKDKELDEKN